MGNKKTASLSLNVLARKEGDTWTGHCLELDIVATANSLAKLKKDLDDLIIAQIDYAFSNNNLDYLYHPAPPEIWEEFFKCKKQVEDCIKVKPTKKTTFVPPFITTKTCFMENVALA
jgi:hypothetical protein